MMISREYKEYFSNAFRFYEEIKKKGKILQDDRELFKLYKDENIKGILEDCIEPTAKVKFVQLESNQTIYIIPSFDNEYHQYSNQELRDLWNLKDNSELYTVQFSMLVLLSMFYNTNTQSLTDRTSVSIGEFVKRLNHYMSKFDELDDEKVDSYAEEIEVDIKSILKVWKQRKLIVETAQNPDKAPSGKVGLLNRVLSFLEREDLVLLIGDEIKLTHKMNALILRYYFNDSRRNMLFDFLESPIFSMKGE